jgi:zinc/manganese transport system substrate-binding protein
MKRISLGFLVSCLLGSAAPALATVRIVTTIPDFGDIAKQVGGDRVVVESLVRGTQDPHFVDARPSFLVGLNRADLLIYAGAELETGYLPNLVQGARNPKILEGAIGHLNGAQVVDLLERPQGSVDRSLGDIHPSGNPHWWLDPRNGLKLAREIEHRLEHIDPDGKAAYAERLEAYDKLLTAKIGEWQGRLARLKGVKVVPYHKSWIYFDTWAGLDEVAYIEPKPGVPPSASSIATLVEHAQRLGARLVLSEAYYPSRTAELVADRAGARYVPLPSMTGAVPGAETYIGLFDTILERLEMALTKT